MAWQLQQAKQRFSEVVRMAIDDGPQTVTRHGKAVVVILNADDYKRLNQQHDFKDHLLSAPDMDMLDLHRDQSMPRDIDLT